MSVATVEQREESFLHKLLNFYLISDQLLNPIYFPPSNGFDNDRMSVVVSHGTYEANQVNIDQL